ncbi:MAG: hypothetical protein ABI389_06425 [Rhodanobacter sp.]
MHVIAQQYMGMDLQAACRGDITLQAEIVLAVFAIRDGFPSRCAIWRGIPDIPGRAWRGVDEGDGRSASIVAACDRTRHRWYDMAKAGANPVFRSLDVHRSALPAARWTLAFTQMKTLSKRHSNPIASRASAGRSRKRANTERG